MIPAASIHAQKHHVLLGQSSDKEYRQLTFDAKYLGLDFIVLFPVDVTSPFLTYQFLNKHESDSTFNHLLLIIVSVYIYYGSIRQKLQYYHIASMIFFIKGVT